MLEAASERLFTASAVMETLPAIVPTKNLPAKSSVLQNMPTFPDSLPYAVLTVRSCMLS